MFDTAPTHQLSDYRFWPALEDAKKSVIDGVWLTDAKSAGDRPHRVLPLGEVGLGLFRLLNCQSTVEAVELTILGAHEKPHWHVSEPGCQLIMVNLRPERMASVLGLSARDFLNQPAADISDLRVASVFRPIIDDAWKGAPLSDLLPRLVTAVRRLEQSAETTLSLEGQAAQLLRDARDPLNLNALATEIGVSPRTLRRRFSDATGFGLKSYARWLRLSRAAIAADSLAAPNWASIAVHAGYYDQSHMIGDFKDLIGLTPAESHAERRAETDLVLPADVSAHVAVFPNTAKAA